MKPYSDNIIFLDTEFTSLNPYKGEILSLGLVKLNGEELYLELECDAEVDEWPKKHVLPTLTAPKVSRVEAVKKIKEFIGNNKPYMIGFVYQFDSLYFYKLVGIENNPLHWLPIDFASILFSMGIDPEDYLQNKNDFYKKIGIDITKYNQHNALDDAKQLREVYLKFIEKK
jgi:DNA polymerase III epsilon subunit-like protein